MKLSQLIIHMNTFLYNNFPVMLCLNIHILDTARFKILVTFSQHVRVNVFTEGIINIYPLHLKKKNKFC